MKIWGNIPKVFGVSNQQKKINNLNKTKSLKGKKDVVSISDRARDFQTVMKALKNNPDMRRDKVSKLADRYDSGNYTVDGKDTADKIIKSILDRKI